MHGISVVMTTYNDETEILGILDSINSQTLLPDEVVIADGGSQDKTLEIIKERADGYQTPLIILEGKRLNFSEGLNMAIKESQSSIICIMANGNTYKKTFIESMYKELERTQSDVCFAPFCGEETNGFSKTYNSIILRDQEGVRIPSNHGLMLRREVYKKIGLYYEPFIRGGEDAEFNMRLNSSKLKVCCSDDAVVVWKTPTSLNEFNNQIKTYIIADMQIQGLSVFKNYKRIYLQIVAFIFFCMGLVRLNKIYIILAACGFGSSIIQRDGSLPLHPLVIYKKYRELYVIFSNIELFEKKYKVDKSKIELLSD